MEGRGSAVCKLANHWACPYLEEQVANHWACPYLEEQVTNHWECPYLEEQAAIIVLVLTFVMEMSQRATVSSGWIISIFILLTVHTLSTSSAAEEVSNNIYSKLKIKRISISNSDSSEHTHSTDGILEVSQIKSAQLENPHTSETNPNRLNDNIDHSSSQLDLREIESLN